MLLNYHFLEVESVNHIDSVPITQKGSLVPDQLNSRFTSRKAPLTP